MKRLLRFLALVIVGAALLPLGTARAATEQITHFSSLVHVSRQNVVTIDETIAYDFGPQQRHGIFRSVPVEYRPAAGTTYYLDFKLVAVTDAAGKAVPAKEESGQAAAVIRIGDPDKTVSGQQTYRIKYQLSPVVTQKAERDHLSLNLTGDLWEVPILSYQAEVSFDSGTELQSPTCFTGKFGAVSTNGCQLNMTGSNVELQSTAPLAPGEGVTVEVSAPAGYVDHYLLPNTPVPLGFWAWVGIAAAVVVGLVVAGGGITIVVMRQWRERRRKQAQTIVAQYEPPADLTPAQVGLLRDDKSTMVEITATLIDLAVRGYVRIEQTKPKSLLRPASYQLTKLTGQSPAKLQPYETALLQGLFGGADTIALADVDKTAMAKVISNIHAEIKEDLKTKGFYGRIGSEPGIIEKALDAGNISDAGAKKWAEVKGFELYLTVAEKDRLKFTDAPEKTPKVFNAFLPYAIALGVEKAWAKQFEGMDLAQDSSWFVGPAGMHYGALALTNDLSQNFSSTISSSFTAPSSGGGGGFSGGGFGGGGGGSW